MRHRIACNSFALFDPVRYISEKQASHPQCTHTHTLQRPFASVCMCLADAVNMYVCVCNASVLITTDKYIIYLLKVEWNNCKESRIAATLELISRDYKTV